MVSTEKKKERKNEVKEIKDKRESEGIGEIWQQTRKINNNVFFFDK